MELGMRDPLFFIPVHVSDNAVYQALRLVFVASAMNVEWGLTCERVFTFEKRAVTNEWGRGNAPGPRLLPDHGFQQPETHLPLPSNSMVRSLIAR